jgi:hypothetical protein
MTRRLFDFICEDGHQQENLVSYEVAKVTCWLCGKDAHRQISAPRISLDPVSGDHPQATARWAKQREEKRLRERKLNS